MPAIPFCAALAGPEDLPGSIIFPARAGSDAHAAYEIGNAYVEMPEFKGKEDFLQALSQGKVFGHRANPLSHFTSLWSRLKKAG